MAENEVIIDVTADTSGAEKSLKKLEGTAKGSGEAVGVNFSKALAVGLTAAVAGIAAFGALMSKSIGEAIEGENAVNELNNALARTGQYSKEAATDMAEFASSLQKASIYEDDVITSNAALIQSLGKLSVEGLKQATQASVDLAAAMNIDLRTASMAVGKAAAGEVGSLSRYGFQIKEGATNAETFSNALKALAVNQGAAASKLNTFGGAMQASENAFNGVLEGIGNLVIKSPVFIAVLKQFSVEIDLIMKAFSDSASGDKDPVGTFTSKLIAMAEALNNTVIGMLATTYRQVVALGSAFVATSDLINNALRSVTGGGLPLKDLLDQYKTTLVRINNELNNPAFGNAIGDSIDRLQAAAAAAPPVGEEITNKFLPDPVQSQTAFDTFLLQNAIFLQENKALFAQYAAETGQLTTAQLQAITNFQASNDAILNDALMKSKARVDALKQLSVDLKSTFVTSFTAMVQGVGTALGKGQNVFAAFGKGVLNILGDMAIKVGANIIAQSEALRLLAAAFANPFLAPASLGAGIALVALGAALKAIGGGGGGTSSASSTSSVSTSAPVGDTLASNLEGEEQGPRTEVNVNIAGNILDRRETGMEIADIINETFSTNGIVMARGAVV